MCTELQDKLVLENPTHSNLCNTVAPGTWLEESAANKTMIINGGIWFLVYFSFSSTT